MANQQIDTSEATLQLARVEDVKPNALHVKDGQLFVKQFDLTRRISRQSFATPEEAQAAFEAENSSVHNFMLGSGAPAGSILENVEDDGSSTWYFNTSAQNTRTSDSIRITFANGLDVASQGSLALGNELNSIMSERNTDEFPYVEDESISNSYALHGQLYYEDGERVLEVEAILVTVVAP